VRRHYRLSFVQVCLSTSSGVFVLSPWTHSQVDEWHCSSVSRSVLCNTRSHIDCIKIWTFGLLIYISWVCTSYLLPACGGGVKPFPKEATLCYDFLLLWCFIPPSPEVFSNILLLAADTCYSPDWLSDVRWHLGVLTNCSYSSKLDAIRWRLECQTQLKEPGLVHLLLPEGWVSCVQSTVSVSS